jgi:tetratricopeptide (TPR) repeat protein
MTRGGSVAAMRLAKGLSALAAIVCVAARALNTAPLTILQAKHLTAFILQGETLLHRVPFEHEFYRLPLPSVLDALLFNHWGASFATSHALYVLIEACLICALATFLRPGEPFVAAAAVAGVSLLGQGAGYGNGPDAPFALLLLLMAGILVWRSHRPSVQRTLLLALVIGTTLICRSPLLLFPPLLAGFEIFSDGKFLKRTVINSAILCLVPYLFLLPWLRFNRIVFHRTNTLEAGLIAPGIIGAVKGVSVIPPKDKPASIVDRICADPLFPKDGCIPRNSWPSLMAPGRRSPNLPGWGALALESAEAGNAMDLVDDSVDVTRPGPLLAWAVAEFVRFPGRYASGFILRLKYLILLHPLLLLSWAASAWYFRKNPQSMALTLLVGYYFLVHSFLVLMGRWFDPLWPVLVAPAAAFAALAWKHRAAVGRQEPRIATAMLTFAGTVAVAGGCAALWILGSYTQAMSRPMDADARMSHALSLAPNDPWLLSRSGRDKLNRGDIQGAEKDLEAAAKLAPNDDQARLTWLWAERLAHGRRRAFEQAPFASGGNIIEMNTALDAEVLKADSAAIAEDAAAVRSHLGAAIKINAQIHARMREFFIQESWLIGETRICEALQSRVDSHIAPRPAAERLRLIAILADLEPDCAPILIEGAQLAASLKRRQVALEFLRRAGRATVRTEMDIRRMLELESEFGDASGALRSARALAAGLPQVPAAWFELAARARIAKDPKTVEAALARLQLLPLSPDEEGNLIDETVRLGVTSLGRPAAARRLAEFGHRPLAAPMRRKLCGALERLGDRRGALGCVEGLVAAKPRDVDLGLELAQLRLRLGDRRGALTALSGARPYALEPEQRHQMALLYQDSGDVATAQDALNDLVRTHPLALYLKDLGISQYHLGRTVEAVATLRRALAADPGLLAAALTLGAIYTETGRFGDPVQVYDDALKAPVRPDEGPLRELLRADRREALARRNRP